MNDVAHTSRFCRADENRQAACPGVCAGAGTALARSQRVTRLPACLPRARAAAASTSRVIRNHACFSVGVAGAARRHSHESAWAVGAKGRGRQAVPLADALPAPRAAGVAICAAWPPARHAAMPVRAIIAARVRQVSGRRDRR
ncbi:hypothetical protein ASF61_04565 [Duganella sp. Leaf126]|nr:hypothetical protein ASF61_04565 [Duganella sp. Leaf126]